MEISGISGNRKLFLGMGILGNLISVKILLTLLIHPQFPYCVLDCTFNDPKSLNEWTRANKWCVECAYCAAALFEWWYGNEPKPGRELINEVPIIRVLEGSLYLLNIRVPPDVNTLIKRVPNPYLANYTSSSVFVMSADKPSGPLSSSWDRHHLGSAENRCFHPSLYSNPMKKPREGEINQRVRLLTFINVTGSD